MWNGCSLHLQHISPKYRGEDWLDASVVGKKKKIPGPLKKVPPGRSSFHILLSVYFRQGKVESAPRVEN